MPGSRSDITPVIDLVRAKGTGPRRTRRPVYVDLLPPCNDACPAGENVQAWLALAQAGQYREAWEVILRDNPLPAVHGRVCYHPCETSCNRGEIDSPVGIHAVERFLGDLANERRWPAASARPSTGRRILVVGAGPSGFAASYHLARLGHSVEIREAGPLPGGMLHFGIPAYRLPRAALMHELRRIEAMGVKLVLDHKVEDVLAEQKEGGFDAVFIAIGAQIGKRVEIPARDAARVVDALTLLRSSGAGEPPRLGRRVIVYGGGNTAMDAARTARRLGASEALIVYRRDRAHMPAHAFEADEALSEGIKIKWLTAIRDIDAGSVTVEVMRLDQQGRPHPTGQVETLTADAVVLALGQEVDSRFLRKIPDLTVAADGSVAVGPSMMSSHPGIFAGGDMVPGARTVAAAIGHGKKAARNIDAWLRGARYASEPKHRPVGFGLLNLPIYTAAEPSLQRVLSPAERLDGFAETTAGLSESEARYEARRCFSCGNCFECDQCLAACPEQAILKLGPGRRYRFDYDRCTGCAVCFEQCPCHAIEMLAEPTAVRGALR
jgi:NADPH-dependent glutamate synthase beta subunit-like oxidoreductase